MNEKSSVCSSLMVLLVFNTALQLHVVSLNAVLLSSNKAADEGQVIVMSKLLKRHSKAKRRAPAYSRALRQIRGVFQ